MSRNSDYGGPKDSRRPLDPGAVFVLMWVAWMVPTMWLWTLVMPLLPDAAKALTLLGVVSLAVYNSVKPAVKAGRALRLWHENKARRSLNGAAAALTERADGRGIDSGDRPTLMHGPEHDPEARD